MNKKLLIDAGNTRVKTAVMDAEGHLEPLFNVAYHELSQTGLPAELTSVWLASVSNSQKRQQLLDWLQDANAEIHDIHSQANAFGVTNAYSTPGDLGVDRWLAIIGAFNEQPKPTLIIDAGTAITVDWVDGEGNHLGGWISPGVDLMQDSVVQRAPRVFSDPQSGWGKPNQLGRNTPDGLANGCVNAFAGLVRQALMVTETELDWFQFRLLFSGGSVPLLPPEIKRRGELRSELVLQGLAHYARAQTA
ncbi:type III pantothenate kinase [Pseudidiomarina sp.]|uniref:type III pantothenate kinase n=1 Tax=Pseudidiomarina sp. TaxID=2081707 RepID=UPI00299CEF28|nr:type III pantothenate kinase [Pseudidiomarina sp.]MDX1705943.1 type III pantothenate kinase [Pseudidiomarina sp.]